MQSVNDRDWGKVLFGEFKGLFCSGSINNGPFDFVPTSVEIKKQIDFGTIVFIRNFPSSSNCLNELDFRSSIKH